MKRETWTIEAGRYRKLLFRSRRRGTREMDLILGAFALEELGHLGPRQVQNFEQLLDFDDILIYRWVTGAAQAPASVRELVERVSAFAHRDSAIRSG